LKNGEYFLIHAAAGVLGLMAMKIAKVIGVRVLVTASTKNTLKIAQRFGADECIVYSSDN
jgi:NADPH:quinone reductase-like Zn-dependent oxidoreductase